MDEIRAPVIAGLGAAMLTGGVALALDHRRAQRGQRDDLADKRWKGLSIEPSTA